MDRLKAMRVFSLVAKHNFAYAAELLGVSKGYVSRHIADLETHLGVQLLVRNTRHIRLTEAGERYYLSCCRILKDLDESDQKVSELNKTSGGHLKILAKRSFGTLQLADAIADFSILHTAIAVSMVLEDKTLEMHDLIEDGFDLAIRLSPLPDSNLVARKIATVKFVTCAAPSYLKEFGTPQQPADLSKHNCLFHLHESLPLQASEWRFRGPNGPISVPVAGKPNANSVSVLRDLAVRGLGIVILPTYCLTDELKAGKLTPILLNYGLDERDVLAVYPPNPNLPRRITEFINFLVKRFQEPKQTPERHKGRNALWAS